MNKTIYALATAFGKSGVAVIRVSGKDALKSISEMTNIKIDTIKPRYAYFTSLKHSQTKNVLDKALVLYFKGPNSFTGEEVVEFHLHGSKAVISSVLDSLSYLSEFRLAEPGEYSKRAFRNNKMDLTEAEGLADLIESETSEQQRIAIRQMEGSLKNLYEDWRSRFIKILAYLEAFIDFPDEDIPEDQIVKLTGQVESLRSEISSHLDNNNYGERLRDGFRVVVMGPPNAGKSSLLNAVTKRQAAIVSDIAGTTRDAIDVYLDINGYPVIFTDTAGVRKTDEEIESQGIDIAIDKASNADLVLCLYDASEYDKTIFNEFTKSFKNKILYIANKSDLLSSEQCSKLVKEDVLPISAKDNSSVDVLLNKIGATIDVMIGSASSEVITRTRYKEALRDVLECLDRFSFENIIELSAEDIRLAARSLGIITGRIDVEELLDRIFGDFCIGK